MADKRITFDMLASDDGALAAFQRVSEAAALAGARLAATTKKLADTMRDAQPTDEDET